MSNLHINVKIVFIFNCLLIYNFFPLRFTRVHNIITQPACMHARNAGEKCLLYEKRIICKWNRVKIK